MIGKRRKGARKPLVNHRKMPSGNRKSSCADEEPMVFLSNLLKNLPGMAYRCLNNRSWDIMYVSQGCKSLTGYAVSDFQNRKITYASLIHKDDRENVWKSIQSAIRNGMPFKITYRIVTRGGRVKWVWDQGSAIGKPGRVQEIIGFTTDITDKVENELKLESLSKFPEQNPLPVMRVDRSGKIAYYNKVSHTYFSKNEIRGGKTVPLPILRHVRLALQQSSRIQCEIEFRGRQLSVMIVPIMDGKFANLYFNDISKIRQAEHKFRQLFEDAPDAYYILDGNGTLLDGNRAAEVMVGYAKDEMIGKRVNRLRLLRKDFVKKALKAITCNLSGKTYGPEEFVLIRKDGKEISAEVMSKPMKIDGATYFLGIARDITERKKAEQETVRSEEKFRKLFESSNDSIFIHEMTGRFREVNKAACERLGYTREELLKLTPVDIDESGSVAMVKSRVKQLMKDNHIFFETVHVAKDGKKIPVEVSSTKFELDGTPMVISNVRDVSDRKQQEEASLRKQEVAYRLSSLLRELARDRYLEQGNLDMFVREVTSKVAAALDVDYASVWLFDKDESEIKSIDRYSLSSGAHTNGETIPVSKIRRYLRWLDENKSMPIADVFEDRKTEELKSYFRKWKVSSLLDTTIDIGKERIGIMSLEHTGEPRRWTIEETMFTTAASDFIALAYEISKLMKTDGELRVQKEASEKLIETAPIVIVGMDSDMRIVLFNKEAERVTGYMEPEVIGKDWFKVFLNGPQKNTLRTEFASLISNSGSTKVSSIITKDKSERRILWSNTVMENFYRESIVIAFGQDITDKEKIENEKQKLNDELKSRIEELERFQRLTVGRELKMIELKARIEKMQRRLGESDESESLSDVDHVDDKIDEQHQGTQ